MWVALNNIHSVDRGYEEKVRNGIWLIASFIFLLWVEEGGTEPCKYPLRKVIVHFAS